MVKGHLSREARIVESALAIDECMIKGESVPPATRSAQRGLYVPEKAARQLEQATAGDSGRPATLIHRVCG
jgi:hypothetical protein